MALFLSQRADLRDLLLEESGEARIAAPLGGFEMVRDPRGSWRDRANRRNLCPLAGPAAGKLWQVGWWEGERFHPVLLLGFAIGEVRARRPESASLPRPSHAIPELPASGCAYRSFGARPCARAFPRKIRSSRGKSSIFRSAGGGTRTHTPLPRPDFESGASAIPPRRLVFAESIRENRRPRELGHKQNAFPRRRQGRRGGKRRKEVPLTRFPSLPRGARERRAWTECNGSLCGSRPSIAKDRKFGDPDRCPEGCRSRDWARNRP